MNLIFRSMRFLVLLIFRWLFGLVTAIFRFVLLPVLLTVFLTVFRVIRDLVSLSFRASVNGHTRFIDRLAGEWTERFHELVDDRSHIYEVFQICRFLVGALIFLGWMLTGFFTVTILRVVFGFFI
jgi:hypothetical protein